MVHRDIKPENILLLGDHVLVADFGLARALHTAGTIRLTESAVAVGTPAYMSPEQAAADPEVDGRTDLYSLACVLFEMVAGVPPFTGASGAALLAQHLTAKPPSICAQRPHCPASIDAAVARALEKTPADRFRTAREFYAALTASQGAVSPVPAQYAPISSRPLVPRRRLVVGGMLLVLAVGVGAVVAVAKGRGWRTASESAGAIADQSSYVVLPLTAADAGARADTAAVSRRIADALGEWDGVHVVGAREVEDQLALTRRGGALRLDDALEIAGRLGAAKLVWGELSASSADSAGSRIARLTVYDVATGRAERPAVMEYRAQGPTVASLRTAASALLRGRGESPWSGGALVQHPSLPAWSAYDAGRKSVSRWDISAATRQFRTAVSIDPAHAQANLWLSLVEMWSGAPVEQWGSVARRAWESRSSLGGADAAIAEAQIALADRRYPDACAAYRRVIAIDSGGVVGWYGLGECQSRDSLVIRDPASPSGWRFRGDMQQAIEAYLRIVDGRAPPLPTFVYTRLAQLLYTAGHQLRPGHSAPPRRVEFGAHPALDGESLVFTPYPLGASFDDVGPPAAARARALEHDRMLLRRLYRGWAAGASPTAEAHAALARLLETLEELGGADSDEFSALGQIRRARSLSSHSPERLDLARTELRLLVKTAQWRRASAYADSLFADSASWTTDSAGTLAGAAALTGRIGPLATILSVERGIRRFSATLPNGAPLDLPPPLAADAATTFAFAVSGACVDTLRHYRQRLDERLASYVGPDARATDRGVLLRGTLALAVPCVGASALLGIDPAGDRMVGLEQSLAARDTATVRRRYAELVAARAPGRPGDASMDYTYMESWILAAIGDSTAAIAHLDRSLTALSTLGAYFMDYPAHSASLVRAMALRAELAAARGDRDTAARWAAAVATLWAHADPALQDVVGRMQALAGIQSGAVTRSAGR